MQLYAQPKQRRAGNNHSRQPTDRPTDQRQAFCPRSLYVLDKQTWQRVATEEPRSTTPRLQTKRAAAASLAPGKRRVRARQSSRSNRCADRFPQGNERLMRSSTAGDGRLSFTFCVSPLPDPFEPHCLSGAWLFRVLEAPEWGGSGAWVG